MARPLAKRMIGDIKRSDIEQWVALRLTEDSKNGGKIKPGTVKKELSLLSALFKKARHGWGLGLLNPAEGIELDATNDERSRRLERVAVGEDRNSDNVKSEEDKIIDALSWTGCGDARQNNWVLPMFQFSIETALRRSEMLRIEWDHVYWGGRDVVRIFNTKNGAKFRDVPLTPSAKAILKKMEAFTDKDDARVFRTTDSAVKQAFRRACVRAGIKDFRWHDLRHEGASRMAEKLRLKELMVVMGHKDTRSVMRYDNPNMDDIISKLQS
jgi:integrase